MIFFNTNDKRHQKVKKRIRGCIIRRARKWVDFGSKQIQTTSSKTIYQASSRYVFMELLSMKISITRSDRRAWILPGTNVEELSPISRFDNFHRNYHSCHRVEASLRRSYFFRSLFFQFFEFYAVIYTFRDFGSSLMVFLRRGRLGKMAFVGAFCSYGARDFSS